MLFAKNAHEVTTASHGIVLRSVLIAEMRYWRGGREQADSSYLERLWLQRASAALRAMALRCSAVKLLRRAWPPLLAPALEPRFPISLR